MSFIVKRRDGRTGYRVFWWAQGRKCSRSFADRRAAQRFAARVEGEKDAVPAGSVTVAEGLRLWLADRVACCSPYTVATYAALTRTFLGRHGALRMDRVTVAQVEAWRNERAAARGTTTVRQGVKALRMLWRWAIRSGYARVNPAENVGMPRIRRGIPGWVDGATADRLLAQLAAEGRMELHLVALLALRAGLRAGEIRALRWVDMEHDTIRVIETKSKAPRLVPLHPQIAEALREWPRREERVFPALKHRETWRRSADQNRTLNAWLRANGYGCTTHGLRHSFASQLAEIGASENELRDLLGHTSVAMTRIYAHSRESARRAHIAQLGAPPPAPATPSGSGGTAGASA